MSNEKEEKNKTSKKKLTYKEISQERAKEASFARKIIVIVLIVLTAIIILGGFNAYQYVQKGLSPVDPDSEETVELTIPLGSSSSDIASILEDEGIIANSLVYRFYVKFNNASDFQAGEYTLSPSMTLADITAELETGALRQQAQLRVTVPEGKSIEEIASIYQEHAGIDSEEFLEKMSDQSYVEELIDQYPNILSEEILAEDIIYPLEGYLFPATYEFYTDEPTLDEIITQMLNKTNDVAAAYYDQIEALDFSVHEVITLASLVEEEAPSEEDRREIARVFYNRLDEGMKLQTDPTVIYAHGEHISSLTYDHYEIDSPYNTYQVQGLPVGPIANFGESSLASILEPDENNYLYFLADSDGNVHYSTTYEEHQNLEDQYIHNE
ncbi:UPF0755 protein [Gracilibacillus orientalis]|uniref:Endolytic murein transglycosylase n=1 Tax=Gracilibacillus orientalis TaxID=334253 RepID=A0A1I4KM82_9BACI|nr:endolytic transglycosylase MltG [Gracilibacillus orientalis]SFL79557.1 UPF0755 protein [Gracilibacillus orientalis]